MSSAHPAARHDKFSSTRVYGSLDGLRCLSIARSALDQNTTRVASDGGEIVCELVEGRVHGDTPRWQFAASALSHGPVELSRIRIEAQTDAAVSFSSLDGEALERSKRILVSVAPRACSTTRPNPLCRAQPVAGRTWLEVTGARTFTSLDAPCRPRAPERDARGLVVPLDFGGSWALIEPAAPRPR